MRTDQGGDTVSEGQAYGMLIAAGVGDEARFRAVWDWTRRHLQRPDHLLAWRWADGAVVDSTPAADADLVAAGALALAGQRFGDRQLVAAAGELGAAVLALETATVGSWQVLLAGPWAAGERVVNPSYFAVGLMSRLYDATGDQRWQPVAATARRLLDELTATAPSLVPDWAAVAADGSGVTARPAPSGGEVTSGFEAGRAYVQLAVDCDGRGPAIAARAWPFLRAEAEGTINGAYRLDGCPGDDGHPPARPGRRGGRRGRRWRRRRRRRAARPGVRPRPPDADVLRRGVAGDRPALARHPRPRRLPALGVVGGVTRGRLLR